MDETPDILKKILARKVEEVKVRRQTTGLENLQAAAADADPVRGFMAGLQEKMGAGKAAVIAEINGHIPVF